MTLIFLDIPDDPQAWPQWLEGQLLTPDLSKLIAELEVVQAKPADDRSLDDVCGAGLDAALQNGLSQLGAATVQQLIARPRLLLELQERILAEGGDYWETQIATQTPQAVGEGEWQKIASTLSVDTSTATRRVDPIAPSKRRRLTIFCTAAAAVLIAVGVWMTRPPAPQGWGFNKSGLLTADISQQEMLTALADAAKAWFNKPVNDTDALITRLEQFDRGCEAVINAELPQLDSDTRDDVDAHCKSARAAIRGYLAILRNEDEPADFDAVNEQVEDTVRDLERNLRGLVQPTV